VENSEGKRKVKIPRRNVYDAGMNPINETVDEAKDEYMKEMIHH
jgi:hypothetical protein